MQYLRYSLAFLIVPTIIFAVLKYHFFIIRGLVNIDYILAGIGAAWLGPILGGLAFAGALLFDIMVSFAPAFHFKAGGFLESVSELMDIEADYVLLVSSGILVGTLIFTVFSLKLAGPSQGKIKMGSWLMLLLVAAVSFDSVSSGNALNKGDTAHIHTNIATSSTFEAMRNLYRWSRHTPPTEVDNIAAAADPLRTLMAQQPDQLPKNIVLIVVESWGVFLEEAANELQASALRHPALLEKYTVKTGQVPFFYSTVPGELRELCGVMMPTIDPDVDVIPSTRCFPKQLSQLGYHTVGIHGFAGNFFNRHTWYPGLGFEEVLFARDIDKITGTGKRCGVAFSGICDADAMDVIHQRLLNQTDRKQFLYWLTLNGHTPFPEPDNRYPGLNCELSLASANSESICRLIGIENVVLSATVETALDSQVDDTAFILVGDHAPPFVEQRSRKLFNHEVVPYAIFWPKQRPLTAELQ